MAAHITAAAPGGARYDPQLTSAERSSIENGIWLCQTHARHIDVDPVRFPAAVLQRWKTDAEFWADVDLSSGRELDTAEQPPDPAVLRLESELRSRRRLSAAGLHDEHQVQRAMNAIAKIEVPEPLQSFTGGSMRVLVGPLGAGKSEIAEAWHRSRIPDFADGVGPVPLWLRAKQIGGDLSSDVARLCGGKGVLASSGCDLVIDELDALSDVRRAGELLDEAAILCERAGNIRILVTSRPDYRVPAPEQVEAPALSHDQALDIASSIAQIDRNLFSHALHPSVVEAMQLPLYAVLVGAEAQDAAGIANRPALLRRLAERALMVFPRRTGVNMAAEAIRAGLRRAAVASTNGTPLRASDLGVGPELLASRAVVEGPEGEIRFTLAIVEQLFAAEALLRREAQIDDLANDIKKTVAWRYPIAVALALAAPTSTTHLLDPLARNHPGLASCLINEAVKVAGRPTPSLQGANQQADDAEAQKPASHSELLKAGRLVQEAMAAWTEGFAELRELLGLATRTGNLRPLGAVLGTRGFFEGCWAPGDRGLPDVFALYSSDGPTQPDYAGPFRLGPGWGPMKGTSSVATANGWQWAWTRDVLIGQLDEVLRRHALAPRPGSMLSREQTWRLALEIQRSRSLATPPSTDPAVIREAIAEIEDRHLVPPWNDYTIRFGSGRPYRRAELTALATHCEELAASGQMLQRPLPGPDLTWPGGMWRDYTKERLIEAASTLYQEALVGYGQLVTDYFPRAGRMFSLTALGPAHVEGVIILRRERGDEEPPAFDFTIRSRDARADLDGRLALAPGDAICQPTADITVEWAEDSASTMRRWERSRRQVLTDLIPRGFIAAAFARPEGAYSTLDISADMPVTKLAYRWLSQDLMRLGWLTHPILI